MAPKTSRTQLWRDLIIAMWHPDFRDMAVHEALGALYDRRREAELEQNRERIGESDDETQS